VSPFEKDFLDQALHQVGLPYLWAARGDWAVRDVSAVSTKSLGCDSLAFDCSGLVTWAAWRAGAVDLRHWWGADGLFRRLPDPEPDALALVFYGPRARATHVAIELRRGVVLEAAGGDETTLTYTDAAIRGARVRVGLDRRADRLGSRSVLALKSLSLKP
jgi:cell wall-associated NlpC family hydrolase